MLVLTRKLNESIMIGNDIEITVLAVEGEQIKLGINAPKQYRHPSKRNLSSHSTRKQPSSQHRSQSFDKFQRIF